MLALYQELEPPVFVVVCAGELDGVAVVLGAVSGVRPGHLVRADKPPVKPEVRVRLIRTTPAARISLHIKRNCVCGVGQEGSAHPQPI